MSWARLLKRVFAIDLEHCPNCSGELKIIAAMVDAPVIERILTHLGLPARAPPALTGANRRRCCMRAELACSRPGSSGLTHKLTRRLRLRSRRRPGRADLAPAASKS